MPRVRMRVDETKADSLRRSWLRLSCWRNAAFISHADRVKTQRQGIPARRDICLESGMPHITGHDRFQTLLLPESLDDYVGAENPVRFIEAFVDGLDLAAAGFIRVVSKVTGRPGYSPKDLLKLYIYGYLNRVRSSRRLEAETHRNIEVIWLLRHLKPDFKTIADFRRDNRNAFRPIFRQFVLLCRQLDLFGRERSPSTAPGSRQSTTRTATSPGRR
jgi:transposase